MDDQVAIRLTLLMTGEEIRNAYYRGPGHAYNGGMPDTVMSASGTISFTPGCSGWTRKRKCWWGQSGEMEPRS